ncbi:hypothetical protein M0811_08126 [Anaeramoeba ignava]|uniref:Uncharacterized protein n=1 Tax=Anaeramoeba ignava TaxID=1746090 RepID=A0A9Q0RBY9_ANAIG|nr:hypothetical protein M0811_08126 [Anaeramoeba ignava]
MVHFPLFIENPNNNHFSALPVGIFMAWILPVNLNFLFLRDSQSKLLTTYLLIANHTHPIILDLNSKDFLLIPRY